jgi:UDP-glucose 4-epimerase
MRALVTGATGFVGSHLTELLVRHGHAVAILRRPGSDPWRLRDVLPAVTDIAADLADVGAAEPAVAAFAPDVVFHLAWHGVGNRHRNDEDQIDRNLTASIGVLRLAARCGCRTFVGLGSQGEYGPRNRTMDESEPTEPTTLYGVAKLCTYLLCKQLAARHEMRFAWLRLFSSYGPKNDPNWMVPYLIRSLLARERPALTAGEQVWDLIHVADAAEAIYRVAATPAAEGVYNLGSGEAHTIRSIVERIRDLIDPSLPLGFGEVPYRSDQVMHLRADVSRLRAATGWVPATDLDRGLRGTVDYYRQETARPTKDKHE